MKKLLIILIIGILYSSCAYKKAEKDKKTEEVKEIVQSVTENLEKNEKGILNIIDTYQEIMLVQKGDKCGEWGGDTDEIRIYKTKYKGEILADYKKTIVDCNNPYSQKNKPIVKEKKEIALNNSELNLAQESITELINYKLTTEKRISHSGIGNYVISRDSTLTVQHWPSFGWPKFRKLVEQIGKK